MLEVDVGSDSMEGLLLERGIGFYFDALQHIDYVSSESGGINTAAVGGIATVATANAIGFGLIRTANPYGIAIGVSILLVPDVLWFGAGYSLFD